MSLAITEAEQAAIQQIASCPTVDDLILLLPSFAADPGLRFALLVGVESALACGDDWHRMELERMLAHERFATLRDDLRMVKG